MAELGDVEEEQSVPLIQSAGQAGRCSWVLRRRYFFLVLVVGAVLFLYNAKVPNAYWAAASLPQYKAATWRTGSQTPQPAEESPESPTTAEMAAENRTEPQTPPPYQSPGPYLVEYPYQYHFMIDEPYKCQQNKPFLVLIVPVGPKNRAHRDMIRSTWGNVSVVEGKVVQRLFLLGRQSGEDAQQLQEKLRQESKEQRDLIQSDFVDCYKNLTIKTMVMMEWLDANCPGTPYAMKIDSDMFLNVPKLISMLINAPKTNYLTGLVTTGGVVLRNQKSKWFVPQSIYPYPYYPRYALGLGYVFSVDLAKKLVEASRHVKALYIEDVYLGMCMQHLKIQPTNPPNWGLFYVFPVRYSRCAYSRLIATTTNPNTDRLWLWNDFSKPGKYC